MVDIIVAGSHLLALHDGTFVSAGNAASRNVVQVWDPTAQVRSAMTVCYVMSCHYACSQKVIPWATTSVFVSIYSI